MSLISLFAAVMLAASAQESDPPPAPSAPALEAQSSSLRHADTEARHDDTAEMRRQAEEERDTGEAMRAGPGQTREPRRQPLRRRGSEAPGTNALGGADPGWGVRGETRDEFGGEDPGWARGEEGSDPSLGGGDPGWGVRGEARRDASIRDRGEYLCQCSGAGSCGSYVEDDALHCSPYDGNGGRICSGSCSMRTLDDGARSTPARTMPER